MRADAVTVIEEDHHAKQSATTLGIAQQAPFDPAGRTIVLTSGSDVVTATHRAVAAGPPHR